MWFVVRFYAIILMYCRGSFSEGVQLLCLIEKSLDACRYLQTYGAWHKAAWLAKVLVLTRVMKVALVKRINIR